MCLIIKNFMLFKKPTLLVILIIPIFLTSCGGGGGGGGSPAPSAPSATISFSTSFDSEVDVGTDFLFSWSTSNAVSCSASGDWSGTVATSGNHNKVLDAAGSYDFTLTCLNSESNQTSRTLSVEANYVLITGNIFDSDNSNKTVYIDENFNNVNDQNEPSGISDNNGSYEIRYSNNSTCLSSFPVKIENSNLGSFNPPGFSEVNISAATSLFAELYNFYVRRDTNSNICDSASIRIKSLENGSFNKIMTGISLSEQYSYDEIQSDPSISNRASISYNRFNEIKAFNSSLESVTSSLVDAIKSKIDINGNGITSSDFEFISSSELDDANVRIFLNDYSYPNPTTDLDPLASSIDDVAVQANIAIQIDNINSLPDYDVNGWDEKLFLLIPDLLINNNNQVVADNSACWINFTSLCLPEINFDILDLNETLIITITDMEKTTSRGLEEYVWTEYFFPSFEDCDVYAEATISEEQDSGLIKTTTYGNNYFPAPYTNYNDGSANFCLYSGPLYKYMTHIVPFEDGSWVYFVWDSSNIDNLENLVESGWYDDTDPPPNTIPQDFVNLMAERPNLYDLNPDFDILLSEDGSATDSGITLDNWFTDILINKIDTSDFYWFRMTVVNTFESNTTIFINNENGYPYSRCEVNDNIVFESTQFGYDINAAYVPIFYCMTLDDGDGNSLLSRNNSIKPSDSYCSPYGGCYSIESSNSTSSKSTKNEMMKENNFLNGDRLSSTHFKKKLFRDNGLKNIDLKKP